jgi:hypothetical protein
MENTLLSMILAVTQYAHSLVLHCHFFEWLMKLCSKYDLYIVIILGSGDFYAIYLGRNQFVRFEVFMAVTIKNTVFWDVTQCGSCKNRHFGGTFSLHNQGDNSWQARNFTVCFGC